MATATILTVASTVISAGMQIYQGNVQAAQARQKAKYARLQGVQSSLQARQKAAELRRQRIQVKAQQTVQAAAGGVDIGSASLINLKKSTDSESERDIQNTLSAGRMALAQGETQGSLWDSSASTTGAYLGAGTTILGGVSQVGKIEGWEGFENLP